MRSTSRFTFTPRSRRASVVTSSVCGIRLTSNSSPSTRLTVRPAQLVAEGERLLQVHRTRAVEPRRHAQGFIGHVCREAAASYSGHREADPLDANRVADRESGKIEAAALHFEGMHPHDSADRLDDPREHDGEGSAKALV